MKTKPMRAEADIIREIERLVEEWNEAIEKGNYTKAAKKSYIRYIKMFLNFCKGGFTSSKVYESTQKSDLEHFNPTSPYEKYSMPVNTLES